MNDAILHACDWRYADIVFNHMANDDRPDRRHIPGAAEHSLSGLPDLDLNQWVIDQQRACLRALNGMKSDGYRCQIHGHAKDVAGDHFTFAIPPREAQMWLCDWQ